MTAVDTARIRRELLDASEHLFRPGFVCCAGCRIAGTRVLDLVEAVEELRAEVVRLTSAQPAPTPEGLTRLTVNLIPAAVAAMKSAAEATGFSRTDTVNRALIEHANTAGALARLSLAVTNHKRGNCSVCDRRIGLKKDGTLRDHVNKGVVVGGWAQRCDGCDKPPAT